MSTLPCIENRPAFNKGVHVLSGDAVSRAAVKGVLNYIKLLKSSVKFENKSKNNNKLQLKNYNLDTIKIFNSNKKHKISFFAINKIFY